jgi:dipeptidyl aminopeptidase/acylaminoacyl peptidase
MFKKILLIAFAASFLLSACTEIKNPQSPNTDNSLPIIEKQNLKLESDIITPEVLWSFGRLSEISISPDKKALLFGIAYYSKEQNKGNRELYTMPANGGEMIRISNTKISEYSAKWRPDGKKIGFLSTESGSMQLWEMNADGSQRTQISDIKAGISGFQYSPDQSKILFTAEVDLVQHVVDIYADLPKADARIINDLMYRHWDTWTDSYSHIFTADYKGTKFSSGTDIMEGEEFDSPLKPFGGEEEISWTPDSKSIAYTCVKKKGKEYALSTNSDIFLYNLAEKSTKNLTQGMLGYDKVPVFSPDGTKIAWLSMARDGYESDKNRLMVLELSSGQRIDLTQNFDQNAESQSWAEDGKSLFFISDFQARDQIYQINIETKEIKAITKGEHNYVWAEQAENSVIAVKQSMSMPNEIFSVDMKTEAEKQLSFVNKDILDQLSIAKPEARWIKTVDGKQMLVWVIYPPHFDATKKYPAILYCEGGPQSTVSQFWSYRWNFQMMTAGGYIVVAPNRRGLPGFGQAWNEQISGDYGGLNMQDYLTAIDEVAKEPYIDASRMGCVGASYGGFSVYWLAGHHNKRFKAFIAHDGMFNLESQYTETEEMWFVNWDLGGAYWDKQNKTAQKSYENSPHKFIDKWDTPILIIHGEKDYRIPATQGMSAFDAAVLRGIPAEFLYFPEENHWVLSPQNGILWQRTFRAWLDRYLQNPEK